MKNWPLAKLKLGLPWFVQLKIKITFIPSFTVVPFNITGWNLILCNSISRPSRFLKYFFHRLYCAVVCWSSPFAHFYLSICRDLSLFFKSGSKSNFYFYLNKTKEKPSFNFANDQFFIAECICKDTPSPNLKVALVSKEVIWTSSPTLAEIFVLILSLLLLNRNVSANFFIVLKIYLHRQCSGNSLFETCHLGEVVWIWTILFNDDVIQISKLHITRAATLSNVLNDVMRGKHYLSFKLALNSEKSEHGRSTYISRIIKPCIRWFKESKRSPGIFK